MYKGVLTKVKKPKKKTKKSKPFVLPKFVMLRHTAMRLSRERDWGVLGEKRIQVYYRDAGHWSIQFRVKNGKVFAHSPKAETIHGGSNPTFHLHGLRLKPISKQEYLKDNDGYIPYFLIRK